MAIVEIENLKKAYWLGPTPLPVLHDVNLAIDEGECIAVMGPSGSGKSTLLNILGCLDRPTGGSYRLGGQDVSQLDDDALSRIRGLHIGFVFQSYNLIAQLNVLENIEVPMYYQGLSERKSRERAMELAARVGLEHRLHHRPSELSGGQQQRVAIARALANDPLVILADEPTGNLDSESGKEILKILQQLHRQGKTLILVTHDPGVAKLTQKVIYLLDGRIERIHNHPLLEKEE
jgi:putative ABC transport system ATP-binding protein